MNIKLEYEHRNATKDKEEQRRRLARYQETFVKYNAKKQDERDGR